MRLWGGLADCGPEAFWGEYIRPPNEQQLVVFQLLAPKNEQNKKENKKLKSYKCSGVFILPAICSCKRTWANQKIGVSQTKCLVVRRMVTHDALGLVHMRKQQGRCRKCKSLQPPWLLQRALFTFLRRHNQGTLPKKSCKGCTGIAAEKFLGYQSRTYAHFRSRRPLFE